MQRNRRIRKIIQEPAAVNHKTNIVRRHQKVSTVKTTNVKPAQVIVPKT